MTISRKLTGCLVGAFAFIMLSTSTYAETVDDYLVSLTAIYFTAAEEDNMDPYNNMAILLGSSTAQQVHFIMKSAISRGAEPEDLRSCYQAGLKDGSIEVSEAVLLPVEEQPEVDQMYNTIYSVVAMTSCAGDYK